MQNLYAPEGDGGAGGAGGSGGSSGSPAGGAAANAGAGGAGGSTLLAGGLGAPAGGAGNGQGGANGGQQNGAPAGGAAGAGDAVPDPFFKGWIDADGKIDPKAYDRLPAELAPYKDTLARFKTAPELIAGMVHSISLNGKKGLMPLPENASEQERAEWSGRLRGLLGVPDKPEGYGVKKPEALPAELWNEPYVNTMTGILHKHNASPALVRELLEADAKQGISSSGDFQARQAKEIEGERAKIQKAWGSEAPQKLTGAMKMAKVMGLDINDPRIGNNAAVIIGLANAAGMFSEDTLVRAGGGDGAGNALVGSGDPRQASLSIKRDPANPLHAAYHDSHHPRHKEALNKVFALDGAYAEQQKRAG